MVARPHFRPSRIAFWIIAVAGFGWLSAGAQPGLTRVTVPTALLRQHVSALTADSLQGRQTGTDGQRQAALYNVRSFRRSHLLPLFLKDSLAKGRLFRQTYPFTSTPVTRYGALAYKGTFNELLSKPLTAHDSSQVLYGDNVAGLLVGTDLKTEIVVVSAHYDHLGRSGRRIFYGADDNASGTATVLSVAAVFDSLAQRGIRSRRSILFVLFSGEEMGMLGSTYFVNNSPIPLNQLICDLNIDMVGRVDPAHRKKPDYCYLIAGRQDDQLRRAVEAANRQSVNLTLDRTYDTENDPERHFYRSDQINFARLGIPVLFFLDGGHPDYHQPTDTADKIAYDVLQKRATLVFQTAWYVANPTE